MKLWENGDTSKTIVFINVPAFGGPKNEGKRGVNIPYKNKFSYKFPIYTYIYIYTQASKSPRLVPNIRRSRTLGLTCFVGRGALGRVVGVGEALDIVYIYIYM